ncbi:Uncharacterised protein [uncultured Clostridium sp.]|nr:Uncharacterised protein [uncultured Clostridium sp.]
MTNQNIYMLYQMTMDDGAWETMCRPLSTFSDLADANEELVDNMVELRKKGYTDAFVSISDVSGYVPNNSKVMNDFYSLEKGDETIIYFVVESPLH